MPWQPALTGRDLWGPDMAQTLAAAHAERAKEERERYSYADKLADRAGALIPAQTGDEGAAKELRKQIEKTPDEPAPPGDETVATMPQATVTVPHSCVSSFGPYNSWAHNDGGPVRAASAFEAPTPRNLHARLAILAGVRDLTVGSGCWFRVDRSGPARLLLTFTHNSHNVLWPGLGGVTAGSIAFAGSVFGASEGRFVDRGGFADVFSALTFVSFASFPTATTSVAGVFDALAGGLYYCAGRVIIRATSIGLFSAANVETNAIMNPLTVCTP